MGAPRVQLLKNGGGGGVLQPENQGISFKIKTQICIIEEELERLFYILIRKVK